MMGDSEQEAEALAQAEALSGAVWTPGERSSARLAAARLVWADRCAAIAAPALPKRRRQIAPGVAGASSSPFAALAGLRRRLTVNDSVQPSCRLWRDAGLA